MGGASIFVSSACRASRHPARRARAFAADPLASPHGRSAVAETETGEEKSAPESCDQPLAELLAQHARRHFLDRALGKLAELKRPERNADEPGDRQPEMAEHVAHFAVLALADGESEPQIRALHAVERRLDLPYWMPSTVTPARNSSSCGCVTEPWARTR